MTKFKDGPAKGQTLMLRRAVVYLRVTLKNGKFDALDQPEDTPEPGEHLFAYRNTGTRNGTCHMRFSGSSRKASGFYAMAEYEICPEQPSQAQMRDTQQWRAWCQAQPRPTEKP